MPPKPILDDRVWKPIISAINRLLPEFVEEIRDDPTVRIKLRHATDLTLVSEFPTARALPESLRHKLIMNVIDSLPATSGRGTKLPKDLPTLNSLKLSNEEIEMLAASAPGNSVRGLLFDTNPKTSITKLQDVITKQLGGGWKVEPLATEFGCYRAVNSKEILSVPEAWDLAQNLEDTSEISGAEPSIEWVPAPVDIGGPVPDVPTNIRRSAAGETNLACSDQKNWHLDLVKAAAAHAKSRGHGVVIGQLDTGLTYHAEVLLDGNNILFSKGLNLFDPDLNNPKVGSKPFDPMITGLGKHPGHGTSTISVITGKKLLSGSAPDAEVIPYRIGPSVVHFDSTRIADGILKAHADGCDIITISMGGPPSKTKYLDKAVEKVTNDGVIICSAAGNQIGSNNTTPLVVWPAALDQVIAVAGCNCAGQIWSGSSRGPEVNITAAAQDVWHALARSGAFDNAPPIHETIGRGHGTSYATPTVAGLAACWLSHHGGRIKVANHYGGKNYVPLAFAYILRTSAFHQPNGWNTRLMGPGLLDAEKLINAALPSKTKLNNGWPPKEHPWFSHIVGGLFESTGNSGPRRSTKKRTTTLINSNRFAGELAYHLFDRPQLIGQFAISSTPDAGEKPVRRRLTGTAEANKPKKSDAAVLQDTALILSTIASKRLNRALQTLKASSAQNLEKTNSEQLHPSK